MEYLASANSPFDLNEKEPTGSPSHVDEDDPSYSPKYLEATGTQSLEAEEEEEYYPEGGRGWGVVLGCFLLCSITLSESPHAYSTMSADC